jgi:hypothetical protein
MSMGLCQSHVDYKNNNNKHNNMRIGCDKLKNCCKQECTKAQNHSSLKQQNQKHEQQMQQKQQHRIQQSGDEIILILTNKTQSILVCFSKSNSIYLVELNRYSLTSRQSVNKSDQQVTVKLNIELERLATYHYWPISVASCASQRPLLLTYSSLENCLKLWDHLSGRLELSAEFDERSTHACLHPSGLYLAVSFFDRVNLYAVCCSQLQFLNTIQIGFIYILIGFHL